MWFKRILGKYFIRWIAKSHGFSDPMTLLGQIRKFAPQSEVSEPIELIRAGALFHARGLINRHAIQHNLDWVWPFWVEQQFDPHSESFLPRAFSITHVNLTHRNWTSVGIPDCHVFPIVDPRGLVTPMWNGWSLDSWIAPEKGDTLIPSRLREVSQEFTWNADLLTIKTMSVQDYLRLSTETVVRFVGDHVVCQIRYQAQSARPAWLVIALRPYNPEGISFIHDIILEASQTSWTINHETSVRFGKPVERHEASSYHQGDVFYHLFKGQGKTDIHCDVGLATAAAMYQIKPQQPCKLTVEIPLTEDPESSSHLKTSGNAQTWTQALSNALVLEIPNKRFQFLYEAALRTLVLLSPDWAYPGPFTYKRFWYRDATFLVHALLCMNLIERAEMVLERFPEKQNPLTGYFHSQEGEWDANGEVLWIFFRFWELTGKPLPEDWLKALEKGANWIVRKRLSDDRNELHAGLFPPGFSAEHLGNIDYYYWDNFWSVAGLRSAAQMLTVADYQKDVRKFSQEADAFMHAIEKSLQKSYVIRESPAIPASPYRRMDSGAVGSLVAGYPLDLLPPRDSGLLHTVKYLLDACFVDGAFFQDMIHSGINAYLSLHVAQVLLRAGEPHFFEIVRTIADLASPTGQWPEAIHPRTKGGCMGDGQHAWAAAEWLMMMRSMFVREEGHKLVLASGIPPEWLATGTPLRCGPVPTPYGLITLNIEADSSETAKVAWESSWRNRRPAMNVMLPGYISVALNASATETEVVVKHTEIKEKTL